MKGFKGGPIKEDRFRDNCRSIGINVCNVYLDSIYSRRTINYAGGIINNRRCHAETLHSLAPRRDENSFLQEGRKGGEEGERSLRMTRVRIYIYIYINMRVQGREIRRRGGEIEASTERILITVQRTLQVFERNALRESDPARNETEMLLLQA